MKQRSKRRSKPQRSNLRQVTPHERERILHLYRVDRMPVRELVRVVGRSSRTVYEVVHADGSVRGNARVDATAIMAMYRDRIPLKQIAEQMQCSESHASHLARISGCRMRGRGNHSRFAAELRLAYDF